MLFRESEFRETGDGSRSVLAVLEKPFGTGSTYPVTRDEKALFQRVNVLSGYMVQQLREHECAQANTNALFDELLSVLPFVCDAFRESLALRDTTAEQVFCEVDADRSVGILNILWQTMSFMTRGNTKPLARPQFGEKPSFSGRILALHGDFYKLTLNNIEQEYEALLDYEVASLYVPADRAKPAVMTVRHLGNEEHYFHQSSAAQQFLLKTLEIICAGGFYHEVAL